MNGWTDPTDPDAPYRRPTSPDGQPRRREPGYPPRSHTDSPYSAQSPYSGEPPQTGWDSNQRDEGWDSDRRDEGWGSGRRDESWGSGRRDAGWESDRRDASWESGQTTANWTSGQGDWESRQVGRESAGQAEWESPQTDWESGRVDRDAPQSEWGSAGTDRRYESGSATASPYSYRNDDETASRPSAFWDSTDEPAADDEPSTGGRRRRTSRKLPRAVILAGSAAVATLVVAVGAGALLIPSDDSNQSNPAAAEDHAAGPAKTEIDAAAPTDIPDGRVPTEVATPTPSASTTTKTAAAPPPAAPVRKPAPPSPRRTATKAPQKPSGGTTTQATGNSSQAEQVVALVNEQRTANGCGAVKINAKLTSAAQAHSEDQASHNKMSHDGSDGSTPWDRAERAGYTKAIGENVAAGYRTPADVMDGWMNSPGHRANILNCQAKAIGVGVATASNGTIYWTQLFGSEV